MNEKKKTDQCVNCGFTFDVKNLQNGFCIKCEYDDFEDYDLTDESCKYCDSNEIGLCDNIIECYSCGISFKKIK